MRHASVTTRHILRAFLIARIVDNSKEHDKERMFICDERATKKKSESPIGIEPMVSKMPVGRSNQLSYERLLMSKVIY